MCVCVCVFMNVHVWWMCLWDPLCICVCWYIINAHIQSLEVGDLWLWCIISLTIPHCFHYRKETGCDIKHHHSLHKVGGWGLCIYRQEWLYIDTFSIFKLDPSVMQKWCGYGVHCMHAKNSLLLVSAVFSHCILSQYWFINVKYEMLCVPKGSCKNGAWGIQRMLLFWVVNRIPVMAPILAPLLGVLFLRGHISLKNRTYIPLLRDSTSPYKSTCLLIRLKEVPDGL
jgi:hypothetical protein